MIYMTYLLALTMVWILGGRLMDSTVIPITI